MILLHRPEIDEYKTLFKTDEERFLNIFASKEENGIKGRYELLDKKNPNSKKIFKPCNFNIIKDPIEIKKVLDSKYSSKGRGEDYIEGLPSATVLNNLYPCNITSKDFNLNKLSLLKWANDVEISRKKEIEEETKISLDTGTYIHKVLEMAILDKCRPYDRLRRFNYYIQKTNNSEECYKKIKDFDTKKALLESKAKKCLTEFFNSEILKIDTIFSEINLRIDGVIQGSADLVNYKNGHLYLSDFKTGKKSYNKGKDDGYTRQLYVYAWMMLELSIISQKEFDNMRFQLYYWNWNTGHFKEIEFDRKEVMKHKFMVNFILKWYWDIKNGVINTVEKKEEWLPQTDIF